jgi:KDO2-lipid IV(A) lauroyltransferase
MSELKYRLEYLLIRLATLPISFLPYSFLHRLGTWLGELAFYCMPKFRKRVLSNLSLAPALNLSSEEIFRIAKGSFHNLMITCLEYAKLAREKDISKIAVCENPEVAANFVQKGQGVIFFCGHQANWEILFLEGTSRMPGVAVGRPILNRFLYRWVIDMREKFGGKIIDRNKAVKEGLRGLKNGAFLGIVGDQAMPESGFSSEFLGRKAFTSTIPALLAYRTKSPLFVATIQRKKGKYHIRYSDPLHVDPEKEMGEEVSRLMHESLRIFENSVKDCPEQWLWQHNRWKRQSPGVVRRTYCFDSLCIAMPEDESFEKLWPYLETLKKIYPEEHLTLLLPSREKLRTIPFEISAVRYYDHIDDLLVPDYAPKLLFNFTHSSALTKHYEKCSVLKVVTLEDVPDLDFQKVLCHAR